MKVDVLAVSTSGSTNPPVMEATPNYTWVMSGSWQQIPARRDQQVETQPGSVIQRVIRIVKEPGSVIQLATAVGADPIFGDAAGDTHGGRPGLAIHPATRRDQTWPDKPRAAPRTWQPADGSRSSGSGSWEPASKVVWALGSTTPRVIKAMTQATTPG